MLKMTVNYTDFDDNPVEEDLYFHVSKAELLRFRADLGGDFEFLITRAVQKGDQAQLMDFFETIIKLSYGERTADGRKFRKTDEIFADFQDSNAYDEVLIRLLSSSEEAEKFIEGIMPKDLNEVDSDKPELPKRAAL